MYNEDTGKINKKNLSKFEGSSVSIFDHLPRVNFIARPWANFIPTAKRWEQFSQKFYLKIQFPKLKVGLAKLFIYSKRNQQKRVNVTIIFTDISQFSKCTNCVKNARNIDNETLKTRLKANKIVPHDSFHSQDQSEENLTKNRKFTDFLWNLDNFDEIRIMAKNEENLPSKERWKLPTSFLAICYF